MKYYNIRKPSLRVSLKSAVLKSIVSAPGLYMPEYLPNITYTFFEKIKKMSLQEIAFNLSKAMFHHDIPEAVLEKIVCSSLSFPIPLKQLSENIHVLELFHGPTLSFKDVGARFMARLFEYFQQDCSRETTILVATSGDTGSAAASAFKDINGINVIILYPSRKISKLQEMQITSCGGNTKAIEVEGDFDHCQQLVKKALADKELNDRMNLASANSINFARLFPQSFYYFHAFAQLEKTDRPVAVSVPSGNFGNLTAGIISKKMGLPIQYFIAATNINRVIPEYLNSGKYRPEPTKHTISNAMDVSDPSNFPRILELYKDRHQKVITDIKGHCCTDAQTRFAIRELAKKYNYIADPHGAIAYSGLKRYDDNDHSGIFLETAHPAKFPVEVEKAANKKIPVPDELSGLATLPKYSTRIPNSYDCLKSLVIESVK
jgi:threonine synthase